MNSVQDFLAFTKETTTDQARIIAQQIKGNVACSSGETWYAFDAVSKLWKQYNAKQYHTYFCNVVNEQIKKIKQLIPTVVCECEKKCTCDRGKLQTLASKMDGKEYINDIAGRAYGELYDPEFETKINSHPEILSIRNGQKINTRTMEVSDKTKEDLCTFECPVTFVTDTPHADKFFNDIMPNEENREFLRTCLGYMLTGDVKARCYFVWYGNGSNGKSVVINLMKKILSNYYTMADKAVFVKPKTQTAGNASPHLYALLGKRMIAYSEGETADEFELNMSILKNISGDDEISCRGLFKDQITFKSIGKLNLLTNYVPRLTAEKAVKDRTRMLFFDQEFADEPKAHQKQRDSDFVDSLENEYLDEVFSWIVKGAMNYFDGGRKIEMPTGFQQRLTKMMTMEDSIESFCKYRVQQTGNSKDTVKRTDLFESYKQYCNDNSQRCQPRSTLYSRLEHMKIQTSTLHGIDIYRGIKVIIEQMTGASSNLDHGTNEEVVTDYELVLKQKDKVIANLETQLKVTESDKIKQLQQRIEHLESLLNQQETNALEQVIESYPVQEEVVVVYPKKVKKVLTKKTKNKESNFDQFTLFGDDDDF